MTASKISDVSFVTDFVSKYQKGMEMSYTLDGNSRVSEFNQKMSSVSILLFHRDLEQFLLVRQFRPGFQFYSIEM